MKHKLLSILLTLCLAFSLLPTAALADEPATVLPEAVNGVITLEKDVKLSSFPEITEPLTIDLNGKMLRYTSTNEMIVVPENGMLTIKNGWLDAPDLGHNVKNVYGTQAFFQVNKGATMVVDNVTLSTTGSALWPRGDAARVTVKDSKIYCGVYAVATNASTNGNYGVIIELTNSVFTTDSAYHNHDGDSSPVFLNVPGTLNMDNCVVNGTRHGVVVRNGDATIKNSTINLMSTEGLDGITGSPLSTYSSYYWDSAWGSGNEVPMAAVVVGNRHAKAYQFPANCKMENVTVTAPDGYKTVYVYGNNATDQRATLIYDDKCVLGEVENATPDNASVGLPVAKVGDKEYTSLAEAIAVAQNGATIKLLKNVSRTASMGTIGVEKDILLDLNGNTITGQDIRAIHVKGGTLTLTGTGVVTSKKTESFDGDSSVIRVGDNSGQNRPAGLVVGENVTIKAPDSYGITVFGSMTTETVTIKGKVLADHAAAIGGNGSAGFGGTEIVIEPSAEVVSTGYTGIYHPQIGTLTINGGIIKGLSAIELKSGETIIAVNGDPTITATGSISHNENNNGTSTSGYAIAVVNNKNYAGSANVTINSGKYTGLIAVVDDQENSGKNGTISITGGLFSSDPSDYVDSTTHHVDGSNNSDYPYEVKAGAKSDATIIVTAATNATVSDTIESGDRAKIEAVKDKANVEGMAAAIRDDKKAAIAKAAGVRDDELANKNMIETEITVKVEAKAADLAKGQLTFEASPVATVKVNGTVKGTVPVSNGMLNNNPITVKLPLPTVDGKLFTPKQILHKFTGGGYEYFINATEGSKLGAKQFTVNSDNCAVFTITKFSTFELSGTVTYVEPSYSSGSSYDPTYSVTVDKTENGTVTVSPKNASKGDTVTVTVKPDSGYVLETLTVTDKNGNELTLKDKGNGKYTFTMPAGKVEVKATFMEDNSMLNFFYDVPNNAYFYEAVKWAVENGITTGVGNDLFAPEQPCTRAQIVTFLWRAAGSPEPKGAASGMTDVVSGSYYEKAVAWAIENGITTGTTTSTFSPDATCTRAQAVTFLARALKAKAASAAEFSDVPTGSYFADAVAWAAANGVTEGIGGGLFGSDNDCTRGQIVTFLYRAYNK